MDVVHAVNIMRVEIREIFGSYPSVRSLKITSTLLNMFTVIFVACISAVDVAVAQVEAPEALVA